jgi:RNA polymerase sigma factor (sigma-70 family)
VGREPSASREPADALAIERSLTTPNAFTIIFDRHFDTVYSYLARRIGRARAEDLAASTFTVAFERRRRFRPDADTARPWLLGIATNLLRNEWRAERRGREMVTLLSRGVTAREALGGETVDQLAPLLAALRPDQREVLLLYAWEELSYEEIAIALGIPIGTVRSRLARARESLKAGLEHGRSGESTAREASR